MATAVKRLIDLTVAPILLVVLTPLLIALWIVVRVSSRGPGLFRQERLGLGERPFVMYKLRSMQAGCSDELHRRYVRELLSSDGPSTSGESGLYKLDNDPRVTRVGSWLRRTSLDELPQLINVVRGEMSLVGPRPVLAWEAAMLSEQERTRFLTKPGLTGLWQVSGRSRLSMRQALALDVEYVRRQSLLLDMSILVRTLLAPMKRGTA